MDYNDTPTYVLVTLSVLIVVLFFLYLAYAVVESPTATVGTVLQQCAPGQCATNIYNGEKLCPGGTGSSTSGILADPAFEVCNSQLICDNPLTPYAVQDDLSTSITGVCQPGIVCRCLTKPQCAEYIVSIFNTANGNPFAGLQGSRTIFTQSNTHVTAGGTATSVPPITYPNTLSSFCTVPLDFLNRSSPGCSFATEMNQTTIQQCMAMNNACLVGTLAFLPDNFNTFSVTDINSTPLACVRGTGCTGPGQVAVWNNELGQVLCSTL
jgi:hypothetical protein